MRNDPPDQPEGYPYTTVRHTSYGHVPVLIDWHPNGYEQASRTLQAHESYSYAKREAVDLAKHYGCRFKVPVHG